MDQRPARVAHVVGGSGRDDGDLGGRGRNDVLDAAGDEAPLHLVRLPAAADVGPAAQHVPHERTDEGDIDEVGGSEQAGAQRVVDVVGVVGDVVGDRGGLRLEAGVGLGHQVGAGADVVEGRRADDRAVVLEDALEGLPAEVQPVMLGVAVLEAGDDAQRLQVVVKAAP